MLIPNLNPRATSDKVNVFDLVNIPAWYADALCAQVDHDGFFPEKGRVDVVRDAKKVCAACPVTEKCLAYAVENRERWGVWGGKSERERRKIEREREAAA